MWTNETCYVAFSEAVTRFGRKHAPTLGEAQQTAQHLKVLSTATFCQFRSA
jgi:hypothetical protein